VPFLYGYHHPGITIDIKNKTAIYLDPFGHKANYPEVIMLQELLKEKGFTSLTVTTRQQTDSVSCGPILTASMIKFIEEFMAMGRISVNDFKEPRPNLATERLLQMYVNNTGMESFVDEIMLADEELLSRVFQEQKLSAAIGKKILDAVKKQKKFIKSLPINWEENSSHQLAVQFIKNFQTQITEYMLLKDRYIVYKINLLVDNSKQLFKKKDPNFGHSCLTELFKKQDLLNENHIVQVYRMMDLVDYSKNSAEQINADIISFEKNKLEIQEYFKVSLKVLKDKLDSLAPDKALKEAGQILFDTLSRKQEDFFKELKTFD
jgi:hypothetical protein